MLQQGDEDVSASDRLAHQAHVAALDDFIERLEMLEDIAVPVYWLQHDEHGDEDGSYCLACAQAKVAELDARDGWNPGDKGEGWFITGGCDPETGPASCATCGQTLQFSIDDSHSGDEIHHYQLHGKPPYDNAHEVYGILQLAEWARWLEPKQVRSMEEVLRIVEGVDVEVALAQVPDIIAQAKVHAEAGRRAETEREAARYLAWSASRE